MQLRTGLPSDRSEQDRGQAAPAFEYRPPGPVGFRYQPGQIILVGGPRFVAPAVLGVRKREHGQACAYGSFDESSNRVAEDALAVGLGAVELASAESREK